MLNSKKQYRNCQIAFKMVASISVKKQQKLNVKNDIVLKKATLYERGVIKKQIFFLR